MEIMKIIPSGNKLWEQVWRLYVDSFPEWERRRISSHSRASEDDDFHTYISIENGNLQGLVFYWEHDSVIYVEHLAVNPLMRGKGIGIPDERICCGCLTLQRKDGQRIHLFGRN